MTNFRLTMLAIKHKTYMLLEADQAKGIFGGLTEGEPEFMKNRGGVISMKKGGVAKQMEMFEPVERGFNSKLW